MKVNEIFNNELAINLDSVEYKGIAINSSKKIEIEVFDDLAFIQANNKRAEFKVERIIRAIPESGFDIKIVMRFCRYFNKDFGDGIDWTKELQEMSDDEKDDLGANVYAKMSVIVSQLTLIGANSPLVMGNCYIPKNKTKKESK